MQFADIPSAAGDSMGPSLRSDDKIGFRYLPGTYALRYSFIHVREFHRY